MQDRDQPFQPSGDIAFASLGLRMRHWPEPRIKMK